MAVDWSQCIKVHRTTESNERSGREMPRAVEECLRLARSRTIRCIGFCMMSRKFIKHGNILEIF